MKVQQFIAADAPTALAKIQEQLGPDAVVLSVRPWPSSQGLGRLLQKKSLIEVLAGVPNETAKSAEPPSDLQNEKQNSSSTRWQSVSWLQAMGLLPVHAERLQTHLHALHGQCPPPSLEDEWSAVSDALKGFWRAAPPHDDAAASGPHVFIGPPGCGKTTVLCKWLTLATLIEERSARVWRLDGSTANTAEFLTIHCEMLGAPVERFWPAARNLSELSFIDLPGVEAHDPQALNALRDRLSSMPKPHVHLVLNAAYDTSILLAQWRAFSVLEPEDLIFTHLDEETSRVKLWNFVFGTNCSIRFLSAGQKVPGEFQNASAELLFPSQAAR